jgi:probable phosphoglycerate mutase
VPTVRRDVTGRPEDDDEGLTAPAAAPRRRRVVTTPADPPEADDDVPPEVAAVSRPSPRPDAGPPTALLLVRHGSTEWTHERRVCGGDEPGPALSAAGAEEVRRLAKVFTSGEFGGLPEPAAVVSSPQLRARQTADILAAELGLDVTEDEGWGELRFGAWHGLTYREIAARWAAEHRAWQGSTSAAPPGGESLDRLVVRVAEARERLLARYPGQAVVVATHIGPVRAAAAAALGVPGPLGGREVPPAAGAFWRLRVSPASLTVVRCWADGGAEVAAANLGGRL